MDITKVYGEQGRKVCYFGHGKLYVCKIQNLFNTIVSSPRIFLYFGTKSITSSLIWILLHSSF